MTQLSDKLLRQWLNILIAVVLMTMALSPTGST